MQIARGEVDPKTVRQRITKTYGIGHTVQLSMLYAAAYVGSDMTASEIWEEVICDSLGDMNIFQEYNVGERAGRLLNEVRESVEAETRMDRGPPAADLDVVGRMSREYSGEQVAWAVQNGIISEIERAAFFHMIANIKKRGYKVNRSSYGGYIIEIGNKLLFTDGDWKSPSLSSVIVFDDTSETFMQTAKDVIINGKHDQAGYEQSRQIIEDAYWPGYVERYTERNSAFYARQNTGGERTDRTADYERTKNPVSEETYSPDYAHWRNTMKDSSGHFSRELDMSHVATVKGGYGNFSSANEEEHLAFIRQLEEVQVRLKAEELRQEYLRNLARLEEEKREAEMDAAFWKYWD